MATFNRADRPRAAGIVGGGIGDIIFAFPMRAADRMDRRKIKRVKTHLGDLRQASFAICECSMTPRFGGTGTRKKFVPRAESSFVALHDHGKFLGVAHR